MTPAPAGPGGARGTERWAPLGVALGALTLALLVQFPYLFAGHYYDDQLHLEAAARLSLGEIGAFEYLFRPHNEHLLPLFRLGYYLLWRGAGLDPIPWHMVLVTLHAGSALVLFLWLRRWLGHPEAAAFGALLWAGAAIGGWENPLLWIASSHLVPALLGLLLAMLVASGARPQPWRWGMLLVLSLGFMASIALLAPAVLLVLWSRRRPTRGEAMTWAIPTILAAMAPAVLNCFRPGWASTSAGATTHDLGEALVRTPLVFLRSLVGILGFAVEESIPTGLLPALGACLFLLVLWVPNKSAGRRSLIAIGLPALLTTGMTQWARSAWPRDQVLGWGRYRYVPTLALVVLLATAADHFIARMPRRRLAGALLVALLVGAYFPAQMRLAASAERTFAAGTLGFRVELTRRQDLLTALSADSASRGEVLTLPDLVLPLGDFAHRLSVFRAFALPQGAENLAFVAPGSLSEPERRHAVARLRALATEAATALADRLTPEGQAAPDGSPALP